MNDIKPKKLIILYILEILHQYSDENHKLTQIDIIKILSEKYKIEVDRRTVKNNIEILIDDGYDISYDETFRINKAKNKKDKKEKMQVRNNFYMERDITDGELRLLIESILFSKQIPYRFRRDLIKN